MTDAIRKACLWALNLNKKVYVVSFPKSGRTWLRSMIGKYLVAHYQIQGVDFSEIKKLSSKAYEIPKVVFTHDQNPHKRAPDELVSTFGKYRKGKIILLIRDPRDVIVSLYHHRSSRTKGFAGSIGEFIRMKSGGIDSLIRFYNIWGADLEGTHNKLILRYEDLRTDPEAGLSKVLAFIGVTDISPKLVSEVVAELSFAKMQKMEINQEVDAMWLRTADVGNPNARKVREGKVGGYVKHLGPDDIRYIEERMKRDLRYFY